MIGRRKIITLKCWNFGKIEWKEKVNASLEGSREEKAGKRSPALFPLKEVCTL
jgi:hypothetical protein